MCGARASGLLRHVPACAETCWRSRPGVLQEIQVETDFTGLSPRGYGRGSFIQNAEYFVLAAAVLRWRALWPVRTTTAVAAQLHDDRPTFKEGVNLCC